MSRAFVKESEGDEPEALPELPLSPHSNYVTARGLHLLQTRLRAVEEALVTLDNDAVDTRLQRAHLNREIRWLQARLAAAIPVSVVTKIPTRVEFGCAVELLDDAGQSYRYRIVGEDEAEPEHGRISWVSPLARALNGAREGDSVTWKRPAGDLPVEILAIDSTPES